MSVDHYENFPVASWLCPPRLRPAIVAIYRYARAADDLADEGDMPPALRLDALQRYRAALLASIDGRPDSAAWPEIFVPLARVIAVHRLPTTALLDLLDAFVQDVHNPVYRSRTELLDYCRRSANPIGRLLLHLYGIDDEVSLSRSDAICSALQLINFWQDFSVDHPRGRCYVPQEDAAAFGLGLDDLRVMVDAHSSQALISALCAWARGMMLEGAALPLTVAGRAGWELRLVVQGGLRILEKIDAMEHRTLRARPRLRAADLPLLGWRAMQMRAIQPNDTDRGHEQSPT